MNDEAGPGCGLTLQRAADGLQALAHAAQPVAFRTVGAAAVVGDFQRAQLLVATEPHTATLSLGVPDDVSHSFAKRKSQYCLLRRTERNSGGVAIHGNSCGFQ